MTVEPPRTSLMAEVKAKPPPTTSMLAIVSSRSRLGGHTDQGMTAARINLILLDSLQHRLTPDDRNTPTFRHRGEDGLDVGNR